MPSDHWYAEVFRALPDLVRLLLPGLAAAQTDSGAIPTDAATGTCDGTTTETTYIFRPFALKKVAHHPDGVLWPRHPSGCGAALPVVILEVRMHPDRRFQKHNVFKAFAPPSSWPPS